MARSDEPAWGERDAQTGYYPQYKLSAAILVRAIRRTDLHWIALADPKAGRVDDFQIATAETIDAYQFKWSRYAGNFSYNDLTKERGGAPSLIRQLAHGWTTLREQNPGFRVVVHLVTNDHPSTSDKPPVGESVPKPRHFSAFVEQVWKPLASGKFNSVSETPESWRVAWAELVDASGLDEAVFLLFLKDCKLEFGERLQAAESGQLQEDARFDKDVREVTEKIIEAVADPQHIVKLTRRELIDRLGWSSRVEMHNIHAFPVDELIYEPIETSETKLLKALDDLNQGYIAVLGPPGSGKSTLLTQTLRYYPHRVVRYYAYVPADAGLSMRGESLNFLHDVLHQIEQAGVSVGRGPNYPDIDLLRARLQEHLLELHRRWLETGTKTIILIDGLDHIPREQHPGRSLLKDLPLPEQIPEGVVFVLGSQTDQLEDLSTATIDSLKDEKRRIEIGPLDRSAVHKIIQRSPLAGRLDGTQIDKVFGLSAGHPLDLAYRLRQLEAAVDDEIPAIIDSAAAYDGHVRSRYSEHWRQIEANYELMDLLGMIARLHGVIDMSWIRTWGLDPAVLHELRRRFAYLFRIEDEKRWYFFHNSFRQFVIEQTARSYPGAKAEEKDAEFHLALAEKCRTATKQKHQWEEIHHLFAAGAHRDLLDRATLEFFREQFLALRSPDAIRADALLAIRSAGSLHDVVSLIRAMFCDVEVAQRSANIERYDLAGVLLSLGEDDAAIEHARIAVKQSSEVVKVFRVCVRLTKAGLNKDAQLLFDIAEPLEILSGIKKLSEYDRDDLEILKSWARTALQFRTFDKIISAIEQIRLKPGRIESDEAPAAEGPADERSKDFQDQILFELGASIIRERRWEDLEKLYEIVLSRSDKNKYWWLRLRTLHWDALVKDRDFVGAHDVFWETIEEAKGCGVSNAQLLAIADAAYRFTGSVETATEFLGDLKVSDFQKLTDFNLKIAHTKDLYRYLKLSFLMGNDRDPVEILPDPQDPRKAGIVFFQRGLAVIAGLAAAGETGKSIEPTELRLKTFPLLRLFNHGWHRSKWDSWYSISTDLKPKFYDLLIWTIALFGEPALKGLADDFEKEWKINARFWSSDQVRKIVLALAGAGADAAWAEQQLEKVAVGTAQLEIPERIDETLELAKAWIRVGLTDKARDTVRTALLDSASIGGKDFQFNEWIGWLKLINRVEPDKAAERIRWHARAVLDLERNGGQSADAAYELFEAAFEWSPRAAVRLFFWFVDEGLVRYEKGVCTLLRSAIKTANMPSPPVETFLLRFVPAACDADTGLIQEYLKAKLKSDGLEQMIEFAGKFVGQVNAHALLASRKLWRSSIARYLELVGVPIEQAGLADADLQYSGRYTTSNNELVLKDGTRLSEEEVFIRTVSPKSLLELMRLEDGASFDWEGTIRRNYRSFNDAGILRSVAQEISWKRSNAPLVCDLSLRLIEIGDPSGAESFAEEILQTDGGSGWATHLTGGTRIKAFEVLTAIHGDAARTRAFNQLVTDLSEEYRYTSSIALYLDEILPLIVDPLPVKELWGVIEPFVHGTFASVDLNDPDEELRTVLENGNGNDPAQALIDLTREYIDHPVGMIANCSRRVLIELLVQDFPGALVEVKSALSGSKRETEAALVVIDAVGLKNHDLARTMSVELGSLADSPDLSHRLMAHNILRTIGIETEIINRSVVAASAVYDFALPPGRTTRELWDDKPLQDETNSLPETDDPYLLLKVVLPELDFIARKAGLSRDVIVHRAGQIFASIAKDDKWSRTSEQVLRNRLDRVALKYPYRRPRATTARFALSHLMAELIDQGRLPVESIGPLFPVLRPSDPGAYFLEAESRPDFTAPPISWRNGGGFAAPDSIVAAMSLRTADGLLIFGEQTHLRTLDWERPTEVRSSVIAVEQRSAKDDGDIFESFARCDRDQYPFQTDLAANETGELVIQSQGRWLESPVPEWLAFNPSIAVRMGWEPDPTRPFGWKNSAGEPMVWSVHWKDGVYDASPPKIGEQVGTGWAVLGTEAAFELVRQSMDGVPKQFLRVDLSYAKDGNEYDENASLAREILVPELSTNNSK